MRKLFLIAIMTLVLVSCSKNVKEDFETTFEKYNDALVSSDLRTTFPFVAEKAKDAYVRSFDEASKIARIFESRIIKKTVDEVGRKARIDVQLDYYLLSSNKVKNLRYVQEWTFIEENKQKNWKVLTPLPEFR